VLREIDERCDELAAAWGAGEISRKEWATAKRAQGRGRDTLPAVPRTA